MVCLDIHFLYSFTSRADYLTINKTYYQNYVLLPTSGLLSLLFSPLLGIFFLKLFLPKKKNLSSSITSSGKSFMIPTS